METSHKSGIRKTGMPVWGWQGWGLVYCCRPALPKESKSPIALGTHHTQCLRMDRMCGMNWETLTLWRLLFTLPYLLFVPFLMGFIFSLQRPFITQVGWLFWCWHQFMGYYISICKSWLKRGNSGMQNTPYAHKSQTESKLATCKWLCWEFESLSHTSFIELLILYAALLGGLQRQ